MFNKKVLVASMAVAMAGGIASNASAMQVSPINVGQVLLGEAYYAVGDFQTDITVVNNRTDAAVKAKVVFRTHKHSAEALDFFIYLSPGDVWRGNVSQVGGATTLTSSDDSIVSVVEIPDTSTNRKVLSWGNTVTASQAFFSDKLTALVGATEAAKDSLDWGHIEVIGQQVAAGTYTADGSTILIERGMSKANLYKVFEPMVWKSTTNPTARNTDYSVCTPAQLAARNGAANVISSISPCAMQLSAEVQISNPSTVLAYNMTALTNVTAATNATIEPTDYVMTNPNYSDFIGSDAGLGSNFMVNAGYATAPSDAIGPIEAALAAVTTSYAYENSTIPLVTFPTKYRHLQDTVGVCGGGAIAATTALEYSAPFANNVNLEGVGVTDGVMLYNFTSFDDQENVAVTGSSDTPWSGGVAATVGSVGLYDEVNLVSNITHFAASGWEYYTWSPAPGCSYVGAPQITTTIKTNANGSSFLTSASQQQ